MIWLGALMFVSGLWMLTQATADARWPIPVTLVGFVILMLGVR